MRGALNCFVWPWQIGTYVVDQALKFLGSKNLSSYAAQVFRGMTAEDKGQTLEEIMTDVILFALVDNGFSTYDAAAEVAETIQLNVLMKQTQLISSFRLTQPLTFESLVHEGHFARAPPTLKLDTYEWINKVAASALGRDDLDSHFWESSSKSWSDRSSSAKYKRMRLDLPHDPIHLERDSDDTFHPHTRDARTERATDQGRRVSGRVGLADGIDVNNRSKLFDHHRRIQNLTDHYKGQDLDTIVNDLLAMGGGAGTKLASFLISKKDSAIHLNKPLEVLENIKTSFDDLNPTHAAHLACIRAAEAEVEILTVALATAAMSPAPRVSISRAAGDASSSTAPRVSIFSRASSTSEQAPRGKANMQYDAGVGRRAEGNQDASSDDEDEDDEDEVRNSPAHNPFCAASMSAALTRALPVRAGAIGAAMNGSSNARRAAIKSIRDAAQAELTLGGGYMCAAQAEADFQAQQQFSLASMYTEKRKGARGRMLPMSQLAGARARVERSIAVKRITQGYGAARRVAQAEESDSDSDGDVNNRDGAVVPNLPSGYASKYTNTPPASGKALEGWVVVAYFPLSKKWFDGVVVLHVPMRGPRWYAVFHEEEDFHELWEVPDPEIFFRLERAGHHVVAVQPSMLPSLTN